MKKNVHLGINEEHLKKITLTGGDGGFKKSLRSGGEDIEEENKREKIRILETEYRKSTNECKKFEKEERTTKWREKIKK